MHRVERLSIREISRRTGLHRKTVRRALARDDAAAGTRGRRPGRSSIRSRTGSASSCEADPTIQSLRLREMAGELGYEGGKTIFDDYVREVRPRFLVKRTFQRTIYRPGELVQCDLWEPRELVPVGHGQTRRGWVVTAELCWSRVIAGRADLLQAGAGHPLGPGSLPRADRRAAGEARLGPRGRDPRRRRPAERRVRRLLRAARGRLDHPRRRRRAGQGRARALAPLHAHQLRARPAVREPARTSSCSSTAGAIASTGGCTARSAPSRPSGSLEERARMRPLPGRLPDDRSAVRGACAAAALPARRSQRLLDRPRRSPAAASRFASPRAR